LNPIVAVFLGALQGATEFLPISSSGHLVIVPALTGLKPPPIAFDVLLHAGTLVAVVAYFRRDLLSLLVQSLRDLRERSLGPGSKLLAVLTLASVPAALAGLLFDELFEKMFASPPAAGAFLLVTAGLLFLADAAGKREGSMERLGWCGALTVGVAQAFAIAPGISRSGSTISAGMFLGLKREEAARFSFLLSIPIVAGTTLLHVRQFTAEGVGLPAAVAGFLAAALVGYACIAFLLRYLSSHGLRPFAVYCLLAGAFTIAVFLLKS